MGSRAIESKAIETQVACTNVPNASVTVAEAVAILRALALALGETRAIRRTLLELLAALDDPK
jgi:hypothetical protein